MGTVGRWCGWRRIKALYKQLNIEIIPTPVGTKYLVDELANPQAFPRQILINGDYFHRPGNKTEINLSI